ncbi:MAG TPA: TIGR03564 family F420-dependent LLM class oxidoreductase, partial [Acidimicrobiia bacterium]|nr:TIGR03564 family F420-dependent LLM class oxidoreductase [Acidimicrobiia bacterium]
MRIGIFGGDASGRSFDDVVASAKRVEADGFDALWMANTLGPDAMTLLAAVSREVPRITFGTGVVPTYLRHPMTMAQQALTVQLASGNRFLLGIGLSHQVMIEGMFGLSWDKPVRHMREYLSVLMPLLADRASSFAGETLTARATVDVAGVSAPPVLVAALGEQMLRLAGTVADGTATWMTGPATIAEHTAPTISAAAKAAGRPAPQIAVSLPVCVTHDLEATRARAAKDFRIYGHLPSYRAMLDREGASGPEDVAI